MPAPDTAASASSNGGEIYMQPMDVPAQGVMAYFADSSGAAVGAWQPNGMGGYEIAAEPAPPHGTNCTPRITTML